MKIQFKIILWSVIFSWLAIGDIVAQTAPSNLVATPKSSSQIDLAWKDNAGNETGFDVQWGENTNYSTGSASITTKNIEAHSVTGLKTSTKYFFRVRAKTATTVSAWVTAEAATLDVTPTAPSALNLSVQNNGTQIAVSWKDNSGNETNFDIEWGQTGNYGSSAGVGANVSSYNITTVPCEAYYVRVKARNSAGSSAWIENKTRTDLTPPAAPSTLAGSVVSSTQINLSWTDNSTNESNFVVQYADNSTYTNATEAVLNANSQSYNLTNLKASTGYYFRVKARNCGGESSWTDSKGATQSPPVTLPSTPANLSASAVSATQIDIRWETGSGGGQPTGFDWQCSTDKTFATVTKSGNTATKDVSVIGLNSNTLYYIRVQAKNSAGSSAWSNVVEATTQSPPVTVPSAPSSLSASAVSSSQINLIWKDNSNNETGFDIERSGDGTTFSALASVDANITTYQSTGLVSNTKYYYRVRSKNSASSSGWSNVTDAITQLPPVTTPSAPASLSASSGSSSQINLSWSDNSNNETGFDIERSGDGSNFSALASVDANITTYQNTGLVSNTKYYYRVRAKNSAGNSGWSNTADATTQQPPVTVPSTPTNLSASAASSSQINLTWGDVINETGYDIERSTDGSSFSVLASVDANVTTYANTGLAASTKYWYRVKAKNSAGNSGWSNTADATTQSPPVTILPKPTNLREKMGNPVINQISIVWDENAQDETGYEVSRATNSTTTWEVLKGDLPAQSKEYVDKAVRTGNKYYYRVRAIRNSSFSEYSDVLSVNAPLVNSVSNPNLEEVVVFPNPATDWFKIKMPIGILQSVRIFSWEGKSLKQWIDPPFAAFDISGLLSGQYVIEVIQDNQKKSFKLIKQ